MDLELERQGRRRHRREQGHRPRRRARRSRPRARACRRRRAHGRRTRGTRRRHAGRRRPRRAGRPGRLVGAALERHGRVDVLVNNVGGVRLRARRLPGDHATTTSSASLQLNFFAALRATRAAVAAHDRARRRRDRQRRLGQRVLPARRRGDRLRRGEGGAGQRRQVARAGVRAARHPRQQRLARAGRDRPLARRRRRRGDDRRGQRASTPPRCATQAIAGHRRPAASRRPRRSRRSSRCSPRRAPRTSPARTTSSTAASSRPCEPARCRARRRYIRTCAIDSGALVSTSQPSSVTATTASAWNIPCSRTASGSIVEHHPGHDRCGRSGDDVRRLRRAEPDAVADAAGDGLALEGGGGGHPAERRAGPHCGDPVPRRRHHLRLHGELLRRQDRRPGAPARE